MQIREMMKQMMKDHKNKVELFQWAIMNGLGSLIYAEYLRCIRQKQLPSQHVEVAPIKEVRHLLREDGPLMEQLSENLINDMIDNHFFENHGYKEIPELVIFTDKYIELTKTLFDVYIIPNLSKRIPEVIAKKFQIGEPSTQGLIIESNEIDLFTKQPSDDEYYKYIVEQTCAQLFILILTIQKEVIVPEDKMDIQMKVATDVLTIEHQNAICPVAFTSPILHDSFIMDLMSFVTNTIVTGSSVYPDNESALIAHIRTSPYNSASIYRF